MASVSDICNMALGHVGSDTTIVSISPPDGSVNAGRCATFYPIARREALESYTWSWAKKREALAPATNPSDVWMYAYAKPSDCIKIVKVIRKSFLLSFPYRGLDNAFSVDDITSVSERGGADFDTEGGLILSNEPDAILIYTQDVTDTTKFSSSFIVFLSYLLASFLAGPIIKGQPGANASGQLRTIAAKVKGEAAMQDANMGAERAEHFPESLAVR